MLAIAGAFPLTSDQPPLVVVDPAILAGLQGGAGRSPSAPAEASRQAADLRGAVPGGSESRPQWKIEPARDPNAPVGPRPAFEANVLDAERRFEATLARIELARSQAEMRNGTRLPFGNVPAGTEASRQVGPLKPGNAGNPEQTEPRSLAKQTPPGATPIGQTAVPEPDAPRDVAAAAPSGPEATAR